MAQSAEDVFQARIFEREERERQRKLDRQTKEHELAEQAKLRIEELIPEVSKTAKKALKRLRKAGWPDHEGGELRQVLDEAGDAKQCAVWRLVNLKDTYAFLGSDGIIYYGQPNVDESLIELIWESPKELERVIDRIKKIQESEV